MKSFISCDSSTSTRALTPSLSLLASFVATTFTYVTAADDVADS